MNKEDYKSAKWGYEIIRGNRNGYALLEFRAVDVRFRGDLPGMSITWQANRNEDKEDPWYALQVVAKEHMCKSVQDLQQALALARKFMPKDQWQSTFSYLQPKDLILHLTKRKLFRYVHDARVDAYILPEDVADLSWSSYRSDFPGNYIPGQYVAAPDELTAKILMLPLLQAEVAESIEKGWGSAEELFTEWVSSGMPVVFDSYRQAPLSDSLNLDKLLEV